MSGPPDLSRTIDQFAFPVTRRRYGASTTNSHGLLEPGPITASAIRAHCYEVSAGDLLNAPEGFTSGRLIEGTTTSEVRVGDEEAQTRPDEIVFDGATWQVVQVTEIHGGPTGATTYFIFRAAKVTREPEPEGGEAYVEP